MQRGNGVDAVDAQLAVVTVDHVVATGIGWTLQVALDSCHKSSRPWKELSEVMEKVQVSQSKSSTVLLPPECIRVLCAGHVYALFLHHCRPLGSLYPVTSIFQESSTSYVDILMQVSPDTITPTSSAEMHQLLTDVDIFQSPAGLVQQTLLDLYLKSLSQVTLPSLCTYLSELPHYSAYKHSPFDIEDAFLVWMSLERQVIDGNADQLDDLLSDLQRPDNLACVLRVATGKPVIAKGEAIDTFIHQRLKIPWLPMAEWVTVEEKIARDYAMLTMNKLFNLTLQQKRKRERTSASRRVRVKKTNVKEVSSLSASIDDLASEMTSPQPPELLDNTTDITVTDPTQPSITHNEHKITTSVLELTSVSIPDASQDILLSDNEGQVKQYIAEPICVDAQPPNAIMDTPICTGMVIVLDDVQHILPDQKVYESLDVITPSNKVMPTSLPIDSVKDTSTKPDADTNQIYALVHTADQASTFLKDSSNHDDCDDTFEIDDLIDLYISNKEDSESPSVCIEQSSGGHISIGEVEQYANSNVSTCAGDHFDYYDYYHHPELLNYTNVSAENEANYCMTSAHSITTTILSSSTSQTLGLCTTPLEATSGRSELKIMDSIPFGVNIADTFENHESATDDLIDEYNYEDLPNIDNSEVSETTYLEKTQSYTSVSEEIHTQPISGEGLQTASLRPYLSYEEQISTIPAYNSTSPLTSNSCSSSQMRTASSFKSHLIQPSTLSAGFTHINTGLLPRLGSRSSVTGQDPEIYHQSTASALRSQSGRSSVAISEQELYITRPRSEQRIINDLPYEPRKSVSMSTLTQQLPTVLVSPRKQLVDDRSLRALSMPEIVRSTTAETNLKEQDNASTALVDNEKARLRQLAMEVRRQRLMEKLDQHKNQLEGKSGRGSNSSIAKTRVKSSDELDNPEELRAHNQLKRVLEKNRERTSAKPKSTPMAKPTAKRKSNRQLIINALNICLAGELNIETKQEVLQDMSESESDNFVILMRDLKNHAFKGLYTYDEELSQVLKLYGNGPDEITIDDVAGFFKYDSGSRSFKELPTKTFSIAIHALVVKRQFKGRKMVT